MCSDRYWGNILTLNVSMLSLFIVILKDIKFLLEFDSYKTLN